MERKAHLQGILHLSKTSSFGFPSKAALPQGPLHGIPCREMPHHQSPPSFIYQSPWYMSPPPPPHTRFPSDGKGPPWREMPVSGDFLNIYSRVPRSPVKELPPRPLPRSLFKERCSIHRVPFIQLSKSLVDEPSKFPKWGPYGKRCPSPEPFLYILQGPQQRSPPSMFPSQSTHRERHSTSRAPFNHISKSLVDEPP